MYFLGIEIQQKLKNMKSKLFYIKNFMAVNEKNKYFDYSHNEVCIKLTMEGSVREKNFKYVTN